MSKMVYSNDGKLYHIERALQMAQAKKSGYSYVPGEGSADAIVYRLPDRKHLFERLRMITFKMIYN